MLFLAALLVLVLVLWMKILISFSHILVISIWDRFSLVLVDENSQGFSHREFRVLDITVGGTVSVSLHEVLR